MESIKRLGRKRGRYNMYRRDLVVFKFKVIVFRYRKLNFVWDEDE